MCVLKHINSVLLDFNKKTFSHKMNLVKKKKTEKVKMSAKNTEILLKKKIQKV